MGLWMTLERALKGAMVVSCCIHIPYEVWSGARDLKVSHPHDSQYLAGRTLWTQGALETSRVLSTSYASSYGCVRHIWKFPEMVVPQSHPLLIGFSSMNHPFLGYPYFRKTTMERVRISQQSFLWGSAAAGWRQTSRETKKKRRLFGVGGAQSRLEVWCHQQKTEWCQNFVF